MYNFNTPPTPGGLRKAAQLHRASSLDIKKFIRQELVAFGPLLKQDESVLL